MANVSDPLTASRFATTQWSVVLSAQAGESTHATEALCELLQAYWYPLYAFARRQGLSVDDAQDAVQDFYAAVLEKKWLAAADPARGRFRSFLLTAFKRFLANLRKRAVAAKRKGSHHHVPLDFSAGERRYSLEPVDDATAEKLFERRWAIALLDQVVCRLQEEQQSRASADRFEVLKTFLTTDAQEARYAEAAERLNISAGAVKVAVHRLRQRYRELLREEITRTLAGPGDVEDEFQVLLAALRN